MPSIRSRDERWLRSRQIAWTAAFMATIGLALIGAGYGTLLALVDGFACPTPGADSEWGELSWSVLPPGPRCTWTAELHGVDRVEGPGPVTTLWLLILAVMAAVLRREHGRSFRLSD